MKLDTARSMALAVIKEIEPHCERIEIAGSIRRCRPHVNDIDLVILPKGPAGRRAIIARFELTCSRVKGGEQYEEFLSPNGWQFDLWFAHAGKADLFTTTPGNWGMLLLARTGSKEHNIKLAAVAKSKGLLFSPHQGILRDDEILASKTEEEIFAALGLPYVKPEDRENEKLSHAAGQKGRDRYYMGTDSGNGDSAAWCVMKRDTKTGIITVLECGQGEPPANDESSGASDASAATTCSEAELK